LGDNNQDTGGYYIFVIVFSQYHMQPHAAIKLSNKNSNDLRNKWKNNHIAVQMQKKGIYAVCLAIAKY
jgi:hypothetical protein